MVYRLIQYWLASCNHAITLHETTLYALTRHAFVLLPPALASFRRRTVINRSPSRTRVTLRQTLLVIAGGIFTVFGLLGLLLPIAPGLLFLVVAAGCFAAASTRFREQLQTNPRMGPYAKRWAAAANLPLVQRAKFGAWLLWATLADTLRHSTAKK